MLKSPAHSNELWVIKLGGSLLEAGGPPPELLEAMAVAWRAGRRFVVVHGGGKHIDRELAVRGIPRRVHNGLRITDETTLQIVVSVLAGQVNKSLVSNFRAVGINAAGLSGADGNLLRAQLYPSEGGIDYGRVGRVTATDPSLLQVIVGAGILPIVASIALDQDDNGPLNVNADAAAVAIAIGLHSQRLVFFTDVEGVKDNEGKVVRSINPAGIRALRATGAVNGGMRPKLGACEEAVQGGVPTVQIAGPSRYQSIFDGDLGGTCVLAN